MDSGQLQERFGRSRNAYQVFDGESDQQSQSEHPQQESFHQGSSQHGHEDAHIEADVQRSLRRPHPAIQQYFTDSAQLCSFNDWRSLPEFPTGEELLRRPGEQLEPVPIVPDNKAHGAWSSKEDYLKDQYAFCREESTHHLRKAIMLFDELFSHLAPALKPSEPYLKFKGSKGAGIYRQAHMTGITLSESHGAVTRFSFSTISAEARVQWETEPRLKTGSLVALTPAADRFNSIVVPGMVAARQLSLLNSAIPEVDIFLPYHVVTDPLKEYIILEDSSSYFEPLRHNMLALQKMTAETFPLSHYLTDPEANTTVHDVSGMSHGRLSPNVDETLDDSQKDALNQILTKEVALVQGPPGTGKTHVSVAALKVLLNDMKPGDPPVIAACQTNHALDQLLGHVAEFEPDFIRLGGRTADKGVIEAHTLFRLKETTNAFYRFPRYKSSKNSLKALTKEIVALLKPFHPEQGLIDHHTLLKHGIISQNDFDCLERLHPDAISYSDYPPKEEEKPPLNPMTSWVGNKFRRSIVTEPTPVTDVKTGENVFIPNDASEHEDDEKVLQDDGRETLVQDLIPIVQKWVASAPSNVEMTSRKPNMKFKSTPDENLKRHQEIGLIQRIRYNWSVGITMDLERIDDFSFRGCYYEAMVDRCKEIIADKLIRMIQDFNHHVKQLRTGKIESDFETVKRAKLIGVTTSGLSKNRAMIAATGAKIVLLEEAGESLECTVVPLLIPSLTQLVQVGDHQQLRPRSQVTVHEQNMGWGVSLFERLVNNQVDFQMLRKQRRMRWEVSRLLRPIYPALEDFETEDLRPAVPGMGDVNTWFLDHEFQEEQAGTSKVNKQEADLVAEFAAYLAANGVAPARLTILTFYTGQKEHLAQELRRKFPGLLKGVKLFNVDSYQGEENDIILLALTRSSHLGFVANPNRVNVALSRATQGLYIFGNEKLLRGEGGEAWNAILDILADKGEPSTRFSLGDEPERRIGSALPVTCERSHKPTTSLVRCAPDLHKVGEGCGRRCAGLLDCGHRCPLLCHSTRVSHSEMECRQCLQMTDWLESVE